MLRSTEGEGAPQTERTTVSRKGALFTLDAHQHLSPSLLMMVQCLTLSRTDPGHQPPL